MNSWLTTQLERWALSWALRLRRAKPRTRRQHGPGWVAPKAMMAGIQAELSPAALALGWVPRERQPGRKGESRYGEFEFERIGPDRIEHMGFDFQYGDEPDVWLSLAVWTGKGGVCTLFRTGNCWNYSAHRQPYWLRVVGRLRREPLPEDPLADALAKGLRRLQIAEAYFREGTGHPDLSMTQTLPPHQWPEDYADRMA